MEFTDVCPTVVSITHWVHGPDFDVFTTSQKVHFVDFLVETLPIHGQWDPSKAIDNIENWKCHLPCPAQWIYEEKVPGEWQCKHLCAIWIL